MFPNPLDVISDVQRPQGPAPQALSHRPLRPLTFSEQGVSQPMDEYSRSFFSFPSIVEPPAGPTDGASRKETQREYRMPGAFPTYSTNSAPDKDTQKDNVKPGSYPAAPANCAPRKETRGEKRTFDGYERLAASTPGNHFEASKAAAAKAKAGYYQKLEADVKAAAQEKNTALEPFSQFVGTDKAESIEDKAGADAAAAAKVKHVEVYTQEMRERYISEHPGRIRSEDSMDADAVAAAKVERVEAYMQEMRERYSTGNAERIRGGNAMDAYSKKGSTRRPATSYEQDLQSIQLKQQGKAKELRDAEAKKAEETKAKMAEYAAKKAQAEAEREECRRDPVNVVAMQFGYELRRRNADARRAEEAAKKAQADTEAEKATLEAMKRAEDAEKAEEKKRAEAAEKAQAEAQVELIKEMEVMERAKAERKKRIDDAAKKAVDEALAQFTRKRAEEAKRAAETKKAEDAKNIEAACLAEQKRVQETYAKMAAETWRAHNVRKLEAATLQTDLEDTAESVAKQAKGAQDANKNNFDEAAKAQTTTKTAERLAELNKTVEEAQRDADAEKAEIVKKQNDAWSGMRKPFHTLRKEAARNDAASTSTNRSQSPEIMLSQALADRRNASKETAPPKAGSESKAGRVNEDTLQGEQNSDSVYDGIPELVPASPKYEPADQRNAPKENHTPKALPDLDYASLGGWAACLRGNPEDFNFANNSTPFTAPLPRFTPLSLGHGLANQLNPLKESFTPTAAKQWIGQSFADAAVCCLLGSAEDVEVAEKGRDKGNAKKAEQREDPWKVKKKEQRKWAEKIKGEGMLQGEQESGVVYGDLEKVKEIEKIRDKWIANGAQDFEVAWKVTEVEKVKNAESVDGWEDVEDPDKEEWEIVDGK
jgi:hypothetical protein